MQSHILATRAVTGEFIRRSVKPLLFWASVILVACLVGVAVLAVNYTAWWTILYLPLMLLLGLLGLAWVVYAVANRMVSPQLNRDQRKQVGQFVDKLQFVTEQVKTPYFIILFRIVRDVYRHKDKGYLYTTITNSKSLASDFNKLAASLVQ